MASAQKLRMIGKVKIGQKGSRFQRRSIESDDARQKSPLGTIHETAALLRDFVGELCWCGTCSQLVAGLQVNSPIPCSVPRLAIWLRQNEPNLWWTHGISVRFSRTGRQRTVYLAPRDAKS
jgi:hypothetical protein